MEKGNSGTTSTQHPAEEGGLGEGKAIQHEQSAFHVQLFDVFFSI